MRTDSHLIRQWAARELRKPMPAYLATPSDRQQLLVRMRWKWGVRTWETAHSSGIWSFGLSPRG